jgi:hypothetical protein
MTIMIITEIIDKPLIIFLFQNFQKYNQIDQKSIIIFLTSLVIFRKYPLEKNSTVILRM